MSYALQQAISYEFRCFYPLAPLRFTGIIRYIKTHFAQGGDSRMATLIPAIGSCVSRMTSGERRLAERLEQKLDDDYLLWYDVPMGPRNTHPDFCVMHPRRGILVLEVKD